MTDRGSVSTANPFQQVREYMFSVVDTLKRDPLLINEGGARASRCFPSGMAWCSPTSRASSFISMFEFTPFSRRREKGWG